MAHVCLEVVLQGALACKILLWRVSQVLSQLRKMGFGAANWHTCAWRWFRNCENFLSFLAAKLFRRRATN